MSKKSNPAWSLAKALYHAANAALSNIIVGIAMAAPDTAFPSWLAVDMGRLALTFLWWCSLISCGVLLVLSAIMIAGLIVAGSMAIRANQP